MKPRRALTHCRTDAREDARDDDELHFAVGVLDLVADELWKALLRAIRQRATRVCMPLETVGLLIDGIEAARTLAERERGTPSTACTASAKAKPHG
jgi:hypothetical protein